MGERWRPVPGWSGYYEVSSLGRVRSVPRQVRCRGGGMRRLSGRVLAPATDEGGYLRVGLWRDGRPSHEFVHRLVVAAFIGPIGPGMQVDHRNGVRTDNRVENLEVVTPLENIRRSIERGGHIAVVRRARTHCPRGHRLEAPNLVAFDLKRRGRTCLACARAGNRHPPGTRDAPEFKATADTFYQALGLDLAPSASSTN